MGEAGLVMESLEMAADRIGDITPTVYENYFGSCEGSREVMSYVDLRVKGRMLEEVLVLLTGTDRHYIEFEVTTHKGYGVRPRMYRNLLDAVHKTVREAAGDDWNEHFESAWQGRVEDLLNEIEPFAG